MRAKALLANKSSEQDVTFKITDEDGLERLAPGYVVDLGCPADGCSLDPDAEFEMETGRPLLRVTILLRSSVPMKRLQGWFNTVDGPRTVVDHTFDQVKKFEEGAYMCMVGNHF